jgi:GNAT superfamily N-acetyltransferase
VVAPEARGKGVGKAILENLQRRYEVLTGAGITAGALPLYLAAGFTFLAHLPRFFLIADFDRTQAFAEVSALARKITQQRQAHRRRIPFRARPVAAADLAAVAAEGLAGFAHFRRDAERLAWRHDRHAAFRYEAFTVADPSVAGSGAGVILREDRVLDTPILHVIDLFGPPGHLPTVLQFLEDEAGRRGAAFVDVSLTAGPLIAHLRAGGWSSAVDDSLIELPSLFYPVELRRPPTTSMVIWGRRATDRLFDLGRLHVTRADMDLDRPTLNWYQQHEGQIEPEGA